MAAGASLAVAAVVVECGPWYGLGVCAVSAAAALVLLPGSTPAMWYAAVFGWYAVAKYAAEQLPGFVLPWCVKLACCNGALLIIRLLLPQAWDAVSLPAAGILVWIAANAVWIVYDCGLTRLIMFYTRKIHTKLPH